jgi:hypothetical protein
LDELLGGGDARLEGFLLVDQQGDELGRADLAAADFRELDPPVLKRPGDELFGVLHRPHSHDGEPAQVRLDEERLAVGVADDAMPLRPSSFATSGSNLDRNWSFSML